MIWYFSLRFGKSQRMAVLALSVAAAALIGGRWIDATTVFQPETVPAAVQTMEIGGADMTERTDFLAVFYCHRKIFLLYSERYIM